MGAMTLARNRRLEDGQPTISEAMVIDAGCVPHLVPMHRSQLMRAPTLREWMKMDGIKNLPKNSSAAKSTEMLVGYALLAVGVMVADHKLE